MNFCENESLKIEFINNTLGADPKKAFERHLRECPGCRQEITELRDLIPHLQAIKRPRVPDSLVQATAWRLNRELSEITPEPVTQKKPGSLLYSLIAGVVFTTTFLLTLILYQPGVQEWFASLFGSTLVKLQALLGVERNGGLLTFNSLILFISLLSLLFIPSIIENIYLLWRKRNKWSNTGYFCSL
jgi:hypothetical protein